MAKNLSGCAKFAIAAGVVFVGGTAIIAAVPKTRNWVVDQFNNLKDKFKSEEKKNEEKKEQIKNDDRYQELDDDNKQKVEDKFDQITNSDEYKGMSDEEKDEIVEKLIESEKIQQDIQKEQEEHESKKEENKQQLESLTNSQQELEKKVQDLKDSGASDEEIKAVEEEQQKVEEQIKAAEQEKIYYETVDTVKDATSNIQIFKDQNPGTSIRKIYGIYKWGGTAYINADIVQTETICGVDIMSTTNCFCRIDIQLEEDESYQKILDAISNSEFAAISRVCSNKNLESHKEFFEQNKYSIDSRIQKLESLGATFEIIESWENEDIEHPEFIVSCQQEGYEDLLFIMTYSNERYYSQLIKKICPEFWAQKEAEQAEEQNENLKNRSEFSTLDKEGNTISFDYSAYLAKTNEQKISTQETQKTYLFSDGLER